MTRRQRGAPSARTAGSSDLACPNCRSKHVRVRPHKAVMLSAVPTSYAVCGVCKTVWEAQPWQPAVERRVGELIAAATPCDNCRYPAASLEALDPALLAELFVFARDARVPLCHKGAPIKQVGPGSFVRDFDAIRPRQRRACAGALLLLRQMKGVSIDWLNERLSAVSEATP